MAGPAPGTLEKQQQMNQQPPAPDYNKDYWAPDRAQVLQSKGIQDTSGKTWNGNDWVLPSQQPQAPNQSAAPSYGSYQSTPGWDNTKLQDPNKHDPKYDWLRSVQSVGGNQDLSKVVDYYNSNYGQYDPRATYGGSGDKVNFGSQYGDIDVLQDQEGARLNLWAPTGNGSQDPQQATGGQGLSFGGAIPNGGISGYGGLGSVLGTGGTASLTGSNGGSVFGPNGAPFDYLSNGLAYPTQGGQLWGQLQGVATQNAIPSANDPIIKNQVDAYDASQQRSRRNYLADLAEKSGPQANLGAEARMTAEQAGQNTASMQATLMGNELTQRRQLIMQALQEEGQFLPAEQQMALQQELGLIDAQLRQQQINSGNDQFMAQLGLNSEDRANYWDAVRSGLF